MTVLDISDSPDDPSWLLESSELLESLPAMSPLSLESLPLSICLLYIVLILGVSAAMGDKFGNSVATIGAMAAVGPVPEAITSGIAELTASEATSGGPTLTAIVCCGLERRVSSLVNQKIYSCHTVFHLLPQLQGECLQSSVVSD